MALSHRLLGLGARRGLERGRSSTDSTRLLHQEPRRPLLASELVRLRGARRPVALATDSSGSDSTTGSARTASRRARRCSAEDARRRLRFNRPKQGRSLATSWLRATSPRRAPRARNAARLLELASALLHQDAPASASASTPSESPAARSRLRGSEPQSPSGASDLPRLGLGVASDSAAAGPTQPPARASKRLRRVRFRLRLRLGVGLDGDWLRIGDRARGLDLGRLGTAIAPDGSLRDGIRPDRARHDADMAGRLHGAARARARRGGGRTSAGATAPRGTTATASTRRPRLGLRRDRGSEPKLRLRLGLAPPPPARPRPPAPALPRPRRRRRRLDHRRLADGRLGRAGHGLSRGRSRGRVRAGGGASSAGRSEARRVDATNSETPTSTHEASTRRDDQPRSAVRRPRRRRRRGR